MTAPFVTEQWRLRDALRGYFTQRSEDDITVDLTEGNL